MKNKMLILICSVIFLVGIAGSVWMLKAPHGTQVNIMQDGKILYSFDLSTTKDQFLTVEYEGRINTIEIKDGRIRMLEAECPDKTCVHMGWLESGTLPIVCLPNHLSIEFTDGRNDIDAVVK